MSSMSRMFPMAAIVAATIPQMAQAYIGPGVGAGALAAVLGVLGALFLAIAAIVYYPVKRLIRGRRPAGPDAKKTD